MLIITALFCIFVAVIFIQLFFYGFIFGNFSSIKQSKTTANTIPVSVIVCAKNEAENLKKFLPLILGQNYPSFEIVLINDASTDKTLKVMEKFKSEHHNIKIVNVKHNEAFWGNKKYALTLGIKAATNGHLLFTDADCVPQSKHWISEMSQQFSNTKSIVIGYGAYKKNKNSFLNKLIRFETMLTAIQYFSYAKIGQPYMGVGRNLAYTKETFFEAGGFISHMGIKSGDDDLFINTIANSSNTALCLSESSFTESIPKKTYYEWIKQKRRHVSTAKHYKFKHKSALSLFYISQVGFWILGIVLLSTLFYWKWVLSLILLRYIIVFTSVYSASKRLNEKDLIPFLPLLELFLIVSQFSIFMYNLISKPKHWK